MPVTFVTNEERALVANKLASTLIALGFLTTCGAHAAQRIEVFGIGLGGEMHKVRNASLRDLNDGYRSATISHDKTHSNGIMALADKSGEITDQMLVLANGNIIWFVGRGLALDRGSKLNSDDLLAPLIKQYGAPSYTNGATVYWDFDRQDRRYQGAPGKSPCRVIGSSAELNRAFGPGVRATPVTIPVMFNPACGKRIEASFFPAATNQAVSHWSLRAYNSAAVTDILSR